MDSTAVEIKHIREDIAEIKQDLREIRDLNLRVTKLESAAEAGARRWDMKSIATIVACIVGGFGASGGAVVLMDDDPQRDPPVAAVKSQPQKPDVSHAD